MEVIDGNNKSIISTVYSVGDKVYIASMAMRGVLTGGVVSLIRIEYGLSNLTVLYKVNNFVDFGPPDSLYREDMICSESEAKSFVSQYHVNQKAYHDSKIK